MRVLYGSLSVVSNNTLASGILDKRDKLGLPVGHELREAILPQHSWINEMARQKLSVLAAGNAGPAWIGVNPMNGKCQLIRMIDPVYTDERGDASNVRLLRVVMTILAELLGGDPSFSHRLSRSPFYTGDDPTAYRYPDTEPEKRE